MWKFIARLAFYLMAVILLAWTGTLTYSFVSQVLPHMGPLVPAFALVVFDGGMLAWMVVYLKHAEGAPQRGVAMLGTIVDLLGVGLMTMAEIFLGGQTLAAAPEQLGEWALWGIGLWTIANVAMVVMFHILSPDARREMALRDAQDHIQDQAFEQLRNKTSQIAGEVAGRLSSAMVDEAVRQLTAADDDRGQLEAPRQSALPVVVGTNGHKPKAAFAAEADDSLGKGLGAA